MAPKRTLILGLTCSLALMLLASCDTVNVQRQGTSRHGGWIGNGPTAHGGWTGNGPLAQAKVQGQRRKQVCGYELVYDTNWGVYIVAGIADCYYHEGYFYRLRGEDWEISQRADSGWSPISVTLLPPGLDGKAAKRARAKARTCA